MLQESSSTQPIAGSAGNTGENKIEGRDTRPTKGGRKMNALSGFYCRHDSCTKKFVNKLSRAGHEKNCQYRKSSTKTSKGSSKTKKSPVLPPATSPLPPQIPVLKPTFNPSNKVYKVDPKVKSKYGDVVFGRPVVKGNLHAIVIEDHPNVSYCIVEPGSPLGNSPETGSPPGNAPGSPPGSPSKTKPSTSTSSSGFDSQSQGSSKNSNDNIAWSDGYSSDTDVTTRTNVNKIPDTSETESAVDYSEVTFEGKGTDEALGVDDIGEDHDCQACRNCTKRENVLFCTSLAETLDRLDWRKQRIAKIRFQEILYEHLRLG